MELFHLKTPYLDCPQCFFYNSRALSGTPYIGIAKQEPEGAEPLMDCLLYTSPSPRDS